MGSLCDVVMFETARVTSSCATKKGKRAALGD